MIAKINTFGLPGNKASTFVRRTKMKLETLSEISLRLDRNPSFPLGEEPRHLVLLTNHTCQWSQTGETLSENTRVGTFFPSFITGFTVTNKKISEDPGRLSMGNTNTRVPLQTRLFCFL